MPRKTPSGAAAAPDDLGASMRPRPDAAENAHDAAQIGRRGQSFNEAAARCRGKRLVVQRLDDRGGRGFNEAAARCRGKRRRRGGPGRRAAGRFNEAAARCRGKRPEPELDLRPAPARASMRPRPDAAENPVIDYGWRQLDWASMRPRPDAAENSTCRVLSAIGGTLQ